jgi:hypothetical protein
MSQEAVDRAARAAKRKRELGDADRCARCGCGDPVALVKGKDPAVCYECRAAEAGKGTVEAHHILGRANDPATIRVPGILHRRVSEDQRDQPEELKHNPDRDPLVWLAQGCQGMVGHLAWWVRALAGVAGWLVALSAALRREHGPAWWTALGLPPFWEAVAG